MANEHGLFFDSVNGDRIYNSDSFAEWLRKFFTTGVFNGDLQVQPSSGMAVTVGTGYANINGRVRFFDTTQTKTLSVANGTYPRIDTIVVRLDLGNREITCETVQGMYSGNNPSPTAPVRSDGIYEIVLAQIYVGAGVTEITAANITDTRSDDTLCGWVASTVESIPVDQITTQMQADFLAWYNRMKDQLSEDAAGHLQEEIDTLSDAQTATANIVRRHGYDFGPENTGTTATQAFSKGDYFMQDNQFAQATADIAEGDTVELGTNYRATTVGDELQTLNNGLMPYPDYANGVEITSSFPSDPRSTSTNSFTLPVNALISFVADKTSQGFTLFALVDGNKVATIPANVAFGGVAMTFPVKQGSVLSFKTDSPNVTWQLRRVDYFPLVMS